MPLFQAPDFVQVPKDAQLVFLAGPIQGTYDWQTPTAIWLLERLPGLYVASPRSHMWPPGLSRERADQLYAQQTGWEHAYLDKTITRMKGHRTFRRRRAVLLFWCAEEVEHIARRAYAQTTRFEMGVSLGYMSALLKQKAFRPNKSEKEPREGIVVGADPKFSGRRYLNIYMGNHGRYLHDSLERAREEVLGMLMEF